MADESFDVSWDDVELVPQMTKLSCWAAAAAMVVGWRDRLSIEPAAVAGGTGDWAAYGAGLSPADVPTLAQAWGLQMEPPQCYTVDGLRTLLESQGPLWVTGAMPSLHAVVVKGMYGDGTVDGTFLRINDPWPPGRGSQYERSLRAFAGEYESAASFPGVSIQILCAGSRPD